ncbi:regulatory protein GemA [Salmonella enterica subsp. enterica serovar Oranienburg]|nr:regulatory protein GemA [Salmonella enterica subsp. enterica serovar Oranienburg]ECA1472535.1 regulatory protein GemA [Salmonella enterica subsp. enterica serovar Oranienburg]ECA8998966.1 regulatory protein GemA [Salmonella enterica subsp. enterica serovar Oranienburg]ECA9345826.1 regulatory protein GemA [Salmonella enterica subsp. enterica serovar Oranienburg]ECD3080730.1 regulatory protein GemA [Salmonella enterica subsp. enterica serovar Oranienburg]
MIPVAKRLIGAIKAGQSFLGWDDATYRGVLFRLTGKRSSTKCSIRELEDVKEYMHSQGFPRKAPKGKGRRPNVAERRRAILAKIEALLADSGLSWAYAEGIASRMWGCKILEWLNDDKNLEDNKKINAVMIALEVRARNKKRKDKQM